ncbi:MAG: cytochrome bc1 complex Rieske iron-sulfur subunit [Nocardioides sp.]
MSIEHESEGTRSLATGGSTNASQIAGVGDPIPDPGLPEHKWRPTDVDPAAEKRAERQVAALFVLSMLCTVLFVVSYVTLEIGDSQDTFANLGASNLALGLSLGGTLLFLGVGIIQWARKLMSDHEIVENRHPIASSAADREVTLAALAQGAEESGIARRPLIRNTLLGALGLVGVAPIMALRDLGPLPGNTLNHTLWRRGMRVVRDVVGRPIKPEELEVGDLVNAAPAILFEVDDEGEPLVEGVDKQIAKSKSTIIVVRMEPNEISPVKGREDWTIDGICAYSKICTHVGCPISLYEKPTHNVLCPCHQSTFDLADGAKVVFGPAARPLPQLPLMVDAEGYLVAQGDFDEPVGPSFWERDSE